MNAAQTFRGTFATLLLAATATALHAQSARDQFVVGGVVPLSGVYALFGTSMRNGVELALEERRTVLSKPVIARWEDSESKPQASVQKASKLISGGANMLFGDGGSGQTLAIMPLAEQRKIPLLVTTSAADQITGANRNRYTFRTTNPVQMEVRMAAAWLKKSGVKSVYGIAVDNPVGHDSWNSMKAALAPLGVSVVGQDFNANGSQDFSLIVDKVAKSGAEATFVAMGGADTITLLRQAGQVRLGEKTKIFGVGILDDDILAAAGPQAAGVTSVVRYHYSISTPANRKFVEAYRQKYNELPNTYAGHAYDGMQWFLDVVEKTGSWNPEDWIKAFETSKHSGSVFGERAMRACDHQALNGGLWSEAYTEGGKALLKVTDTFPAEGLHGDCPR